LWRWVGRDGAKLQRMGRQKGGASPAGNTRDELSAAATSYLVGWQPEKRKGVAFTNLFYQPGARRPRFLHNGHMVEGKHGWEWYWRCRVHSEGVSGGPFHTSSFLLGQDGFDFHCDVIFLRLFRFSPFPLLFFLAISAADFLEHTIPPRRPVLPHRVSCTLCFPPPFPPSLSLTAHRLDFFVENNRG